MSRALSDKVVERQAAAWVAKHALGTLSPDDLDAFGVWLGEDPHHRAAFDRLSGALHSVEGVGDVLRGVHLAASRREAMRRRKLAGVASIASVALLAWLWQAWPADLQAGRGQIRHYQLADGSQVWLDANSSADVEIDGDHRRIRLREGRLHVRVAHEARSFVVSAAGREVVDIGTEFDVALEADGGSAFVTQGAVEVRGVGSVPLGAGQGLRWQGDQGQAILPEDGAAEANWRGGEIVFKRRPLSEVIAMLDRYSSRRLVLLNGEAGRRLVSGVVRARDIDARIGSLAEAQGLSATDLGVVVLLR